MKGGVSPIKIEEWRALLLDSAQTFRRYEALHLAKVAGWRTEIQRVRSRYMLDPEIAHVAELERLIADTTAKAASNGALALRIEESLRL